MRRLSSSIHRQLARVMGHFRQTDDLKPCPGPPYKSGNFSAAWAGRTGNIGYSCTECPGMGLEYGER